VLERGTADDMITVSFGPNTVLVAPGTVINRFIRQLTKRFIEIELVLEQAEEPPGPRSHDVAGRK
jgi:hypothetical protein